MGKIRKVASTMCYTQDALGGSDTGPAFNAFAAAWEAETKVLEAALHELAEKVRLSSHAGRGSDIDVRTGAHAVSVGSAADAGVSTIAYVAKIVQVGGLAYAAGLAEPLPSGAASACLRDWLETAAQVAGTPDDEARVARRLDTIAELTACAAAAGPRRRARSGLIQTRGRGHASRIPGSPWTRDRSASDDSCTDRSGISRTDPDRRTPAPSAAFRAWPNWPRAPPCCPGCGLRL
ncbi:hypothetical protein [Streptomyces sp. NPDC018833]|uniref:hypothetical protein n=1 Tax=Streptomyces sp. NPDC018833 TaxID=3365053 RepID=UPI0037B74612